MKKLNPSDLHGASIFKDGKLTQLIIVEVKGRRNIKQSLSYPLYLLLKEFLSEYGIGIGGAVMIGDYKVTAVTIAKDFPPENEPILRELYDFTNGSVNIQLHKTTDEDCAYAFDYDLTDYSCTFKRYYLGSTTDSKKYASLVEMLKGIEI